MLEKRLVKESLSDFGKNVQFDSRTNLLGRNASGRLARSIGYDLDIFPNSFSFSFEMEEYGDYLDQGVSGTKVKYNTPYSFTNKMPPTRAFDQWVIRRGLAGRDAQGRFTSREQLKFAIAKKKFTDGQEPTLFFSKPLEQYFKELPDELIEAYALDIEDFIRTTLDAE